MASKSQADSQNNTLLNVQLPAPETAVCLYVVLHAGSIHFNSISNSQ